MENTKERELSLEFLFEIFKKGILWIALVSILCAAIVGGYTALLLKDSYSATFGYWISNTPSGAGYTSSSVTTASTQIAADCTTLVRAKRTVKQVVTDGGLAKYFNCSEEDAIKQVTSMISASKPSEESIMFYVTVSGATVEDVLVVSQVMQTYVPTIVAEVNNFKDDGSFIQPISPVEGISDVRVHSPSLVKNVVMAFMAGAIGTYVLLFTMTMLSTTVYGESTIKDNFDNVPVLGSIPTWESTDDKKRKRRTARGRRIDGSDFKNRNYKGRLISEKTPFAITEAFNTLGTSVTYSIAAEKCPVLVVSGAIPGVGKSVVASNLALVLANNGKRVLLVECDMRRPSFERIFENEVAVGLSEYLSGKTDDSRAIITDYNGLNVVHAGHISPNPVELLSSERMASLISEWKESYDVVILDTPPICSVVDSRVIAKHVSGYIFVVRSHYSNIKDVKQAVGYLDDLGAKIVGFVVNDKDLKGAGEYYPKYRYYNAPSASEQA